MGATRGRGVQVEEPTEDERGAGGSRAFFSPSESFRYATRCDVAGNGPISCTQ
jgi:hypothetical protein